MDLYGSTTSPFVRRTRLLSSAYLDDGLVFHDIDIFDQQGRELLSQHNPTLKVPFLLDGEHNIYDSRVIFRYLAKKFDLNELNWQQENQLTLIDAASDSLVEILLLMRSGIDPSQNALFFNLQRERLGKLFAVLEQQVERGEYNDWYYPAICLYCLIDWAMFRELVDFSPYPSMRAFHQQYASRDDITRTDPR
ncbi:glutathione S-transferase family protein [Thalassotalea mangrovi]|uniref:Glutathione S-transferase family protein n=1 Tax=Thalassotalea mangrovi TaxID=2572245 RepID=A0A4U1BAL3_9GAMM|nr:glutathione S-transferase family protein [Thalassotalea mangrovi]TKB47098.1 glutathione S-transferase family protein [Thalassotalea mangrovi]